MFSVARSLGFFVPFFVTGVFFDIRDLDFCIFVGWCFSQDASYRFTVQIIINRLTPLFFRLAGAGLFFVYGPFLVCRFTVEPFFFRYPVFGFLRFFVLQFFIEAHLTISSCLIFFGHSTLGFFRDRLL